MFGPHCLGGKAFLKVGGGGRQSFLEARDRGGKQDLKVKVQEEKCVM